MDDTLPVPFLVYYLAALSAAVCWSLSSMISVAPSKVMGSFSFNRLRINLVFVTFLLISLAQRRWPVFDMGDWTALLLSGMVGIFIGDTLLFTTLNRLGPRRTQVLFSTNAFMTLLFSFFFLPENVLTVAAGTGSVLIVAGVICAIAFGGERNKNEKWEATSGKLRYGILCGLLAAACQSFGVLIAKPVLEDGFDPFAASTLRIGIAGMTFIVTGFQRNSNMKHVVLARMNFRLIFRVYVSGMLGMGIGMTLLVYALSGGHPGVVSSLASCSPFFLLLMIWYKTKALPSLSAWMGALMIVIGCFIIFTQ